MKILTIRQPWAWLIIHGGKDIENRDWPTRLRGRFLVHAAKGMTRTEWEDAIDTARHCGVSLADLRAGAQFEQLQRGGIIGSVNLIDCVTDHPSRWFFGKYGFVLANPV
ncbi:MAG: ASCH domain-containing protein, partial [Rubrivivax sp.]